MAAFRCALCSASGDQPSAGLRQGLSRARSRLHSARCARRRRDRAGGAEGQPSLRGAARRDPRARPAHRRPAWPGAALCRSYPRRAPGARGQRHPDARRRPQPQADGARPAFRARPSPQGRSGGPSGACDRPLCRRPPSF